MIQIADTRAYQVRAIAAVSGNNDPLAEPPATGPVVSSPSGRCQRDGVLLLSPGSCTADASCPPGATCVATHVTVASADTDLDGIPDELDNCPHVPNTSQSDLDHDGVGDACDADTGSDGIVGPEEQCDDGNLTNGDGCSSACTLESACPPTPKLFCRRPTKPAKAQLQMKNVSPDTGDSLGWKWGSGATTPKSAFGTPTTGTGYVLCVWDANGGVQSLALTAAVPGGGTCGGKPCWKESSSGFKYHDAAGSAGGIVSVQLKAGASGKAHVQVKGKGTGLALPSLPLHHDPGVTVQLKNNLGECWEADFSTATRSDATEFKAKSD